jgi:hypothetical protein
MVFLTEHDEVHVQLFGALEDHLRDIVFRRAHDLSVGFDAPSASPIIIARPLPAKECLCTSTS